MESSLSSDKPISYRDDNDCTHYRPCVVHVDRSDRSDAWERQERNNVNDVCHGVQIYWQTPSPEFEWSIHRMATLQLSDCKEENRDEVQDVQCDRR